MKKIACAVAALLVANLAMAQGANSGPRLISVWQSAKLTADSRASERDVGLENMDTYYTPSSSNCADFVGPIRVEGVQFSSSGGTLEQFRFTDKNGSQWSVPTNIGALSNVDRQRANSLIRVGGKYYVHVQACGSGGIATLISLYDANVAFGPVR